MNEAQRTAWIDEVLGEVLDAVMHADDLRQVLILKGAWILNLHLLDKRRSLDIDAASTYEFVSTMPDLADQGKFLKEHLAQAVRHHFESQSPVRFVLNDVKITRNPPKRGHPRGWDMINVRLYIHDNNLAGVRNIPPAEIEIAAPELFGPGAIETRKGPGISVRIYSLHRIAGEKLRAYLTSLPEYRAKVEGGDREFRVKDLHDLARIVRMKSTTDLGFWRKAAGEFRLACESRLVDCQASETFKQKWSLARSRYEADRNLSRISFAEAEFALDAILALFTADGVFPLAFPKVPLKAPSPR